MYNDKANGDNLEFARPDADASDQTGHNPRHGAYPMGRHSLLYALRLYRQDY